MNERGTGDQKYDEDEVLGLGILILGIILVIVALVLDSFVFGIIGFIDLALGFTIMSRIEPRS